MSTSLPFSILVYLISIAWLAFHGPLGSGGWSFGAVYALAFVGMVGIWKSWPNRGGLAWMIGLATAPRLLMLLDFPASDDVFRYLWEGRIQLHGFNPFRFAPDDPALAVLRTDYWTRINHPDWASIYFPFSQWLFRVAAFVRESPIAIKIIATVFDLGTAVVLSRILRKSRFDFRHLCFYALNPLVILFAAGEGHFETVLVFWLAAVVWASMGHRWIFMYAALGLALMTNVKAAIFLPLFIHRENLKFLPAVLPSFALAIPFLEPGVSFLDIPTRFASELHFNGMLFAPLAAILSSDAAVVLCGALFLCLWGMIFFLTPDTKRAVTLCAASFLICAPTMHPWYLLLLTPWLALYPSPFWNTLHVSVAAIFPVFANSQFSGQWTESPALFLLEYLPPLAAFLWFARTGIGKSRSEIHGLAKTVSVVVPVLNERENIEGCLESLASSLPSLPPCPEINLRARGEGLDEVIVVDGGSTDGTVEKIQALPGSVKVLASEPGRGTQIARGVAEAKGDVILILHADSRLRPGALQGMLAALNDRADAVGGCFGTAYSDPHPKFRFVAWLNNARARFAGIGFGDQAQFFRAEAMKGRFPAYRLMEDIELSLRLKETGSLIFIPNGVVNSTRRWSRRGYLGNGIKVVWLSALFLARRRFGNDARDGDGYYRRYYGGSGAA